MATALRKKSECAYKTHSGTKDNCQPVICFDEFRSSIKMRDMLLYCDIYPIELPSRYSNKFACYNKIYIVSNISLEKQYPEVQRQEEESWKAFLRRIHKVVTYDETGKRTEYNSPQEYLNRDEGFVKCDEKDVPFENGGDLSA